MRHGNAGLMHPTLETPRIGVRALVYTFVFRSDVWTGQAMPWQNLAETLFRLLELREELDPKASREAEQAREFGLLPQPRCWEH